MIGITDLIHLPVNPDHVTRFKQPDAKDLTRLILVLQKLSIRVKFKLWTQVLIVVTDVILIEDHESVR